LKQGETEQGTAEAEKKRGVRGEAAWQGAVGFAIEAQSGNKENQRR
jgi:hypothetical protein